MYARLSYSACASGGTTKGQPGTVHVAVEKTHSLTKFVTSGTRSNTEGGVGGYPIIRDFGVRTRVRTRAQALQGADVGAIQGSPAAIGIFGFHLGFQRRSSSRADLLTCLFYG